MFLSRITLLPDAANSPAFWETFRDAYAAHQEVWRWAGAGPDAERDFLYRIDEVDAGRPQVMVLGPRPVSAPPALWRAQSKPWQPRLQPGQQLGFTLRANAVVRQGHHRHDVVMHARKTVIAGADEGSDTRAALTQQAGEAWFRGQGEPRGFTAGPVVVAGHHVAEVGARRRAIRLGILDLEGTLRVDDPAKFLNAVVQGFGPAKGFGYGLMLLRPV
jgi:CRISPR system Cascade subunit CasE